MEKSINKSISSHEDQTLQLLKRILVKANISFTNYSLSGYSDDAVCLEKIDGDWICYIGSRSCKNNIQKFSDVKWACVCVIDAVSDSYESEAFLIEEFLREFDQM